MRFRSTVNEQVFSQSYSSAEWFVAFGTTVQLFSSWLRMRVLRWVFRLNDLLHSLHLCSFFPLCVKRWVLRCPARPNVLWHCLHLCNISPVWVSRCLFRVVARLNDLLHSVHLCSFSPLCVSMWVLRFPARPNDENYFSRRRIAFREVHQE